MSNPNSSSNNGNNGSTSKAGEGKVGWKQRAALLAVGVGSLAMVLSGCSSNTTNATAPKPSQSKTSASAATSGNSDTGQDGGDPGSGNATHAPLDDGKGPSETDLSGGKSQLAKNFYTSLIAHGFNVYKDSDLTCRLEGDYPDENGIVVEHRDNSVCAGVWVRPTNPASACDHHSFMITEDTSGYVEIYADLPFNVSPLYWTYLNAQVPDSSFLSGQLDARNLC